MTKNISAVRRAAARQGERLRSVQNPGPSQPPPPPKPPASKLYSDAASDDASVWVPGMSTAVKILLSLRMSAGIWSPLSDCDEVYNYWEPLHFLLYGTGFQTWEYSPLYAIRSYAYLLLHAGPVRLFQVLLPHTKVTTFFYLRCFLGALTGLVEAYLFRVASRRLGNGIGRIFLLLSAVSAGMFIASSAFLPSSFSMALSSLALGLWLDGHLFLSVFLTAASSLLGWPFVAVLGAPIVASMLKSGLWQRLLGYSVLSGFLIGVPLIAVDSHFFGRITIAPLNILLYNVFSGGDGANLYGTEPLSYYLINLGLNWNLAFPLALLALPSAFLFYRLTQGVEWRQNVERLSPVLHLFLALALWLAIFGRQAHKEERFLFPIYPLIALCAAVTLDALHKVGRKILARSSLPSIGLSSVLLIFAVLSGSRALSLYRNFHAPFDAYMKLGEHLSRLEEGPKPVQVCVGKEWYRFPSSFFLPSHTGLVGGQPSHYSYRFSPGLPDALKNRSQVTIGFIESEFRGLLPGQFPTHLPLANATRLIPEDQNALNREEPLHYVPLERCHFLIDLESGGGGTEREPDYASLKGEWETLFSEPFLLKELSRPLYRAFFLPFLSDRNIVFGRYSVLARTSLQIKLREDL